MKNLFLDLLTALKLSGQLVEEAAEEAAVELLPKPTTLQEHPSLTHAHMTLFSLRVPEHWPNDLDLLSQSI